MQGKGGIYRLLYIEGWGVLGGEGRNIVLMFESLAIIGSSRIPGPVDLRCCVSSPLSSTLFFPPGVFPFSSVFSFYFFPSSLTFSSFLLFFFSLSNFSFFLCFSLMGGRRSYERRRWQAKAVRCQGNARGRKVRSEMKK